MSQPTTRNPSGTGRPARQGKRTTERSEGVSPTEGREQESPGLETPICREITPLATVPHMDTEDIQHDPLDDSCPCDECEQEWLNDAHWMCLDCGIHTGVIGEYYMVTGDLWHSTVTEQRGMLCVGCLESRIMRPLSPADFTNVPLNTQPYYRSERLRDRLGMG